MDGYDYDLIVIGGGSGGMACSKAAAALGAKVALFDYVKPSNQGTTWGLGGTCVNVGCVPKKLCHFAGLIGHSYHDGEALGWNLNPKSKSHDWEKLIDTVMNHVRMLNFRYKVALKNKNVTYINALASFINANTIGYSLAGKDGGSKQLTAKFIVIAVGGRPYIPDIPGLQEYGITSDDIFSLDHSPGKTLCIGSSYISLECAGFLTELGYPVTVLARSILLRGFDRQCADFIGSEMIDSGTKIVYGTPTNVSKGTDGKLNVAILYNDGTESIEKFDTIIVATGRRPDIIGLNLNAIGVNFDVESGKIPVIDETTNVANIFAIGDVCEGKQELTPVAIRAGELLVKRLFANSTEKMNYNTIATTVFTPNEYGTVGLSEEEAIAQYGEDDIEVYLTQFTTLEHSACHRLKHDSIGEDEDRGHGCMSKLICLKSQSEKVIGFHFIGPNAGEVTQGFALAVKLGATKADFDGLVGIHPTDAESFCALSITKRSGQDFAAVGGCGGGVCG